MDTIHGHQDLGLGTRRAAAGRRSDSESRHIATTSMALRDRAGRRAFRTALPLALAPPAMSSALILTALIAPSHGLKREPERDEEDAQDEQHLGAKHEDPMRPRG